MSAHPHDSVVESVNQILVDVFEVEEDQLKPDALLGDDLGLDSLDGVDLIVAIEKTFDCRIEEARARKIRVLHEVYELVQSRLAEVEGSQA